MDPIEVLKVVVPLVALTVSMLTFVYSRRAESEKSVERIAKHEERIDDLEEFTRRLDASLKDLLHDVNRNMRDVEAELVRRLVNVEAQASSVPGLTTKVDLFWSLVEEAMPRMLMHSDALDRDVLLAKMENRTLKPEEAQELKALLEVDLAHMNPQSKDVDERFRILITKFVIKRADSISRGIR